MKYLKLFAGQLIKYNPINSKLFPVMKITKNITIEDLVDSIPQSVKYLMDKGIQCIACGESVWGTLEEAAREKGFTDEEIQEFVRELQEWADDVPQKP